jgi:hypothetical protein
VLELLQLGRWVQQVDVVLEHLQRHHQKNQHRVRSDKKNAWERGGFRRIDVAAPTMVTGLRRLRARWSLEGRVLRRRERRRREAEVEAQGRERLGLRWCL